MTKNLLYFTLIRIFPFCFNILETFTFLRECRVFMDAAFSWFLSQGISRNSMIKVVDYLTIQFLFQAF